MKERKLTDVLTFANYNVKNRMKMYVMCMKLTAS